jgi:ABC-type Mn2+/Zn2+ transport system ATPase subunit
MEGLSVLPDFRLTIKNYRCFSDEHPLHLQMGPGFTAFVGPNNAGKSTLLRFFYELRNVFMALEFSPDYGALLEHGGALKPLGTSDLEELFNDGNERDIRVEFDFPAAGERQISRFQLIVNRKYGVFWKPAWFLGPERTKITSISADGEVTKAYTAGGPSEGIAVDMKDYHRVMYSLYQTLYVGPFRNVNADGTGEHYDLQIGRSFVQTWVEWKTGEHKQQRQAIQRVTNDICRIFGYGRLEINANLARTELQVVVDDRPYTLREMGAGLAQFIVVFGSAAFRSPAFLLIDEPEAHLHPSLQMEFLTSLASYARYGVLYATHSLGLARSTAPRIYSLQKRDQHTTASIFEQTPNYAEFAGEMSFSAFREMGHDLLLLVEGVHEVKAVQQFLRALGKEHTVVIIPLGGSQFITKGRQHELAELQRLTANVAVLIDSEKSSEAAPVARERQEFVNDCRELGFRTHVTERRAFENYLAEHAIRAIKGPKYSALGRYQLLNDGDSGWGKHENWRIAREMSREDVLATDIGKFLEGL